MTSKTFLVGICSLCLHSCVFSFQDAHLPPQSTYVTKYGELCPSEGYFFKKDHQNGSPTLCYLCFCRDNSSAVCWPRNNRRCDPESYQHNWVKKRVSRNRRSPLSFGNLFMADAARDALNSNGKKECKPHEASYSVGCPPDDWCVGCTVCDCNTNGKWDCHLLSFCTEEDKKKDKSNWRNEKSMKYYDPFTTPKTRRAERKIAQQAVQKLAEKMAQDRQKKKIGKNNYRRYFFKNGTLVNKTIFDLRKRKKSATIIDQGGEVMAKWNDVNMKIRKIPDEIQKQMMHDKQNKNAKKVSESANYIVRKMANQKTKQKMQKLQAEAVNVLAKREPLRKKKRQIILPSGVKLPKEILKKLPNGVLPPAKDSPDEHLPKTSHVKRVLNNQMTVSKASKNELPKNEFLDENELPAEESKKVLVKRSTQENIKTHNKPSQNSKSTRKLRDDKATIKGSKIINKNIAGLKEKSKQKNVRSTNTKITDKRHLHKNNNLKNNDYNKKNKTYKNNKISFRNNRAKRANITKKISKKHSSKRRSLKNNYPKNNTNSQRNKIIKRRIPSKSNPKKTQNNKKSIFVVKQNKERKNASTDDKNIKAKKPINKLSKSSKTKNITQIKESPRNKRTTKEVWTKTVQEGNKIKKIAPKNEFIEKKLKKRSTNTQRPQIDKQKLNEKVKKISGDIQANMNRRIIEAVGRMIGKDLTNRSRKVKRSVISNEIILRDNSQIVFNVSPSYVDILGSQQNIFKKETEKQNDSLIQPLSEDFKPVLNKSQILKVHILTDDLNNDDIYVPTAYHNKKRLSNMNESEPLPSNKATVIKKLIDTHVNDKIISEIAVKSKNDANDSSKLSQKISIEKSDKAETQRPKRGAGGNISTVKNLQDVENEIPSNALQDVLYITANNKHATQDSTFEYYKYAIDNDDFANSTDKNAIPNEEIQVYTKNGAAKRSVDKQIQSTPDFNVLQITSSLSRNNNITTEHGTNEDLNIKAPNKTESITENENLKVNVAEINIHKPTNVLDDRVVIIEDHNASSIEHVDKFITSLPTSSIKNDLQSNLVNITVIGVKKQENRLNKKSENQTHITKKLNNEIEVNYGTMVDKTVVIINDQKSSTNRIPIYLPMTETHLSTTTEENQASYNLTNVNVLKLPIIILTTEPTKSSTPYVHNFTNTTEKTLVKNVVPYNNDTKSEENIVLIRENQFPSQKAINELSDSHSTNVLQLTTENYKKAQYNVDTNITNQEISSSENEVNDIGITVATPITTTMKTKIDFISTAKIDTNDYLTYKLEKKTYNLTHSSGLNTKLLKLEKLKSKKKQLNVTQNLMSKYNNRFMQNNSRTKAEDFERIVKNNSESFLTENPQLKTKSFVVTTHFDNSKIGNRNSTDKVHNFTTLIYNNTYSSTTSLPKDDTFTADKSNYTELKKKLKSNEITKVNLKKHRLKKILTTLYNRKNVNEKKIVENKFEINKTINKVNDMKDFFKKLMSRFKFNKHSRKKSNNKKFQILKYLQKFFKQIFDNEAITKNNKTLSVKTNKKHIIETLCKSFGPCNINIKNKAKLQSHLDHLNSETYKMLRSVKIIKGLLKLIGLPRNDKNRTTKIMFKSDVQKLHEILREKYSNGERLGNLTETQKTQIQYIKNNTQNFIRAAAKFTVVLNEIINIITAPNDIKVKSDSDVSSEKDRRNIFKDYNKNKTVTPTESHESLLQLKELISKYSLIQNTFMRKIYNVLTDLGGKEISQNKIKKSSLPQAATRNQNKTEEIQVYTKNIIENLRKLKNLAHHLNGNVRRKREIRDEDSFDYMLMLMEYLLKQRKPLDSVPVNDGIDLLLEAIKSAPDIKSVQKKVFPIHNKSLIYKHLPYYRARPAKTSTETNRSKESSDSNSISDSKHTKEDSVNSSESDEPKGNAAINFFEDDTDENDYFRYSKRTTVPSTTAETTVKETTLRVKKPNFEHVTESHYKNISETNENLKPTPYVVNSNEESFNRFTDYEAITRTVAASESDYSSGGPAETVPHRVMVSKTIASTKKPNKLLNNYIKVDEDVSASKSRLDWLDETYEEELRAEMQRSSSTTEEPPKRTESHKKLVSTEKTPVTVQTKKSTSTSRFSKMIHDISTKASTKEIMYKKELDLLNSLDYAAGKAEDVSASRESGTIDKYSGDNFAT